MVSGQQLVRNSAWSVFAFILNIAVGIALTLVIPHILGKDQYGLYSYYLRCVTWITSISILFVPRVIARYITEFSSNGQKKIAYRVYKKGECLQFIFSTFVTVVSILFLSVYSYDDPDYNLSIFMVVVAGFLSSLYPVRRSLLEAELQFRMISRQVAVGLLLRLLGVLLLILAGSSRALWLMVVLVAEQVLLVIYSGLSVRKVLKTYKACQESSLSELPHLRTRIKEYGLNMGVAGVFSLVLWGTIEVFFIRILCEPGIVLSELSYYCLAVSMVSMTGKTMTALAGPLLAAFTSLYSQNQWDKMIRWYQKITMVYVMVCGAGCLWLYMASDLIFTLLPVDMLPAIVPFRILLIPTFFLAMALAAGPLLQAAESHIFYKWSSVIACVVNLLLDIYLIPRYGATGAALVNCLVQSLLCLLSLAYIHKFKNIIFPINSFLKLAGCLVFVYLSNVCLSGCGYALSGLLLLLPVYLLLLVLLKLVKVRTDCGWKNMIVVNV